MKRFNVTYVLDNAVVTTTVDAKADADEDEIVERGAVWLMHTEGMSVRRAKETTVEEVDSGV